MEVAASLAGFIALTDLLIIRYTRLVDAWKDAPTAVVAIRESLVALRPVLARLDELRALPTADPLFGTSLDTAPFRRILQALQQLVDDLTTPAGDIRMWQRTRWTLGKNQRAAELNRNLDSLVALFNLVLLLAMQKSGSAIEENILNLVDAQTAVDTPVLEAVVNLTQQMDARMATLESSVRQRPTPNHSHSHSHSADPWPSSAVSNVVLRGRRRIGGHQSSKATACSHDCERCWGVRQVQYLKTATVAPHSGRTVDAQTLLLVDFVSRPTVFGRLRFLLSIRSRQEAWSLSFPSIALSKQNILPADAPIFELSRRGDFAGIVDLFRRGSASPNDRTVDGQTPLSFAIRNGHLSTARGLLDEQTSVADDDGMMLLLEALTVDRPEWGEFPLLLLERGVDPFLWDNPGGLFPHTVAFCQGARTVQAMAEFVPRVEQRHFAAALEAANPGAIDALLRMGFDANAPLEADGTTERPPPILVVARSLFRGLVAWPQAFAALRRLLGEGADPRAAVPSTGATVLHDFFFALAEGDPAWPTQRSYDDVCQCLVHLLGAGADPRAVDRRGRTPSQVAWSSPLRQAGVLAWYRVLRMCGLDPRDIDARYDARFDAATAADTACYICAARPAPAAVVLCPWCCGDAYESHVAAAFAGSRKDPALGVTPCCPTAVCPPHRHRAAAQARRALLLPAQSGAPLRRVAKCAAPHCEVCAAGRDEWNWHPHYMPDSDGDDSDSSEEGEFHDAAEAL